MRSWFVLVAGFLLGVSVVLSEGFSIPTKRTDNTPYCQRSLRHHHHHHHQQQRQQVISTLSVAATTTTNKKMNAPSSETHSVFMVPPGGAASSKGEAGETSVKCPFTKTMTIFGSLWGSMGVVYVLVKAIRRVLPIAMEPFGSGPSSLALTPLQWSMYVLSCVFFAYAEGYKGFHLKFAPLVVKRSFTLVIGTPQGNNPLNYLFSPMYSMGLFCATRKRLITSWSVTLGVAAIVAVVKRLPIVPRCILDAGVIVGLSLGSISIAYHYIKAMVTGELPKVDACIPTASVKNKKD